MNFSKHHPLTPTRKETSVKTRRGRGGGLSYYWPAAYLFEFEVYEASTRPQYRDLARHLVHQFRLQSNPVGDKRQRMPYVLSAYFERIDKREGSE